MSENSKNIILSSFGFRSPIVCEKYRKLLPPADILKEKTCIIIPFASANESLTGRLEKEAMVAFGFSPDKVSIAESNETFDWGNNPPDYIYVPGGDSFGLLNKISASMRKDIKDVVLTGKTAYIGVSAGAYLAGTDIEYVTIFEDNNFKKTDYAGLGLIAEKPICHAEHYPYMMIEQCKSFSATRVFLLRDDQVVVYKGDDWTYQR